jgi:hypothetical protein
MTRVAQGMQHVLPYQRKLVGFPSRPILKGIMWYCYFCHPWIATVEWGGEASLMPRRSDPQRSWLWLTPSLSASKRARGAEFLRQQMTKLERNDASAQGCDILSSLHPFPSRSSPRITACHRETLPQQAALPTPLQITSDVGRRKKADTSLHQTLSKHPRSVRYQSNENLSVVEPQRCACGLPYHRCILVLAATSSGAANSQQIHHCAYLPTTVFALMSMRTASAIAWSE